MAHEPLEPSASSPTPISARRAWPYSPHDRQMQHRIVLGSPEKWLRTPTNPLLPPCPLIRAIRPRLIVQSDCGATGEELQSPFLPLEGAVGDTTRGGAARGTSVAVDRCSSSGNDDRGSDPARSRSRPRHLQQAEHRPKGSGRGACPDSTTRGRFRPHLARGVIGNTPVFGTGIPSSSLGGPVPFPSHCVRKIDERLNVHNQTTGGHHPCRRQRHADGR